MHCIFRFLALLALVFISNLTPALAQDTLFREDFHDIKGWEPFSFVDIEKKTRYFVTSENDRQVLAAESNDSASAIIYDKEFDISAYPMLRWKWKVTSVYGSGNIHSKKGDDCPFRIYIMFPYNPETAGGWMKFKYAVVKKLYGKYPPHSSITFIWANTSQPEEIIPNAYTDRARMVVVRAGKKELNTWLEEEVNMLEYYRRAFGEDPPGKARIAIMNDSDNTGESSISFMDYIEVSDK